MRRHRSFFLLLGASALLAWSCGGAECDPARLQALEDALQNVRDARTKALEGATDSKTAKFIVCGAYMNMESAVYPILGLCDPELAEEKVYQIKTRARRALCNQWTVPGEY